MGLRLGSAMFAAAILMATASQAAEAWKPPRTADGRPDLNGVWTNASVTQLTRPPGVPKLVVSKPEADALVKANPFMKLIEAEEGASDLDDDLLADGNSDRGYNTFWIDPGRSLANVKGEWRTSWIVEPASGQMPFTAEGRRLAQADRAARRQKLWQDPEALPLEERCMIGFSGAGGPGMLNTIYNNNYQLVQTRDAVVIVVEMVHDARTIPLFEDAAKARAAHGPIPRWLGDSVGWWEGDTLVIETTNVHPAQGRKGPIFLSPQGRVTERLTRTSAGQITYEFTVDDPVYYSQPWRAEMSLNARKEQVYEYACHEGNYAMRGILAGARLQEAQGITPTEGPGIFGTPVPAKKKGGD
ncbi:MAG: hypothetical protein JNK30_16395 [Phenylobacterium sp.]|uniref:hypothetical protein n=1 Tax=Phenylobacterium sp. TaxID=1871053 RepID=UPI001A5739F0|nr:hypothetical protein [Phenylobacterium sp.]MBL8772963.1 hypothetical protein [Phenylobacterium sp.]